MNNISFEAKLKINPDFYRKVPKRMPKDYPDFLVSDFKKFIDSPKIQKATDGDIIEITGIKQRDRHAVKMNFISDKLTEPLEIDIVSGTNDPKVKPGSLKYWTLRFLCLKKGEKQRFGESSFRMIERVLFDGKKVFPGKK